jgi:ESF2/ABP1 family protein
MVDASESDNESIPEVELLEGEEAYISDDSDCSESSSISQSSALFSQNKELSLEKLATYNTKIAKSGLIYLSRIPPFMKPAKIKQLLSFYGELGRVFLTPEDPSIARRRKKYRGNKRTNFTYVNYV